jgi:enamine deaminase RidA (YjgF/YER057c/UK114 family)
MNRRWIAIAIALCLGAFALSARQRHKHDEEPKTEVLPLPPQLPMALAADTNSLDFHISPLLRTGGLDSQIRQCLGDLIRDTHGETIIKLRAFVSGAGDARRVEVETGQIFTEHKLPLPVVSIVQVGALGTDTAAVVIEAVVSTKRMLNPAGLAFFSGQSGANFRDAVSRLVESAHAASVAPEKILTSTCFVSTLTDFDSMTAALKTTFPNSAVDIVQPLRVPEGSSATCEAVGQLSAPPRSGPLLWLSNARATLVDSPQLVFTGLQLTFGNYLDDAHEAFIRLERAASAVQPVEAPVEINAFALDPYAAAAVRKMTAVPPETFTVETVEGLPAIDASAGIEAILAPNIQTPVSLVR